MTEWEYHIETVNLEYKLDEGGNIKNPPWSGEHILSELLRDMGSEGWELASFIPAQPEAHSQLGTVKNPWVFHVVFKRPAEKQ
jgi:hypothetical protein